MTDRPALPESFLRPIAHRGLHRGRVDPVAENTTPAFEAALEASFGIECDVRAAANGLPVVFHDRELFAPMAGAGRSVSAMGPDEVAQARYPGGAGIPTLLALLDLIAGRVPLVVELKCDGVEPRAGFIEQVAELATLYRGPIALMSFDVAPMLKLATLAPDVPRGLVARRFDKSASAVARLGPDAAGRLSRAEALDDIAGSFVAYRVEDLPFEPIVRLRDGKCVRILTWTVRSQAQLAIAQSWADAPIVEGEAAVLCRG